MTKLLNVFLEIYIEAAKKLEIDYEIINPKSLARFRFNGIEKYIHIAITPLNNSSSAAVSRMKDLTNKILRNKNLPVPIQLITSELDDGLAYFLANNNKTLVIKPRYGIGGKNITIKPANTIEFINAFNRAKSSSKFVIIEDYLEGKNYRVLVLKERVIAVAEREPAYIIGDGVKTINELILIENALREKDTRISKILIDELSQDYLKKCSMSLLSVPKKAAKIYVRENSNLSTGGVTHDVSDIIHPENKEIAINATKEIGLQLAGVDIITPDISLPISEMGGGINEINSNPGLRIHLYPNSGKSRDVHLDIMRAIFSESK